MLRGSHEEKRKVYCKMILWMCTLLFIFQQLSVLVTEFIL